MNSVKIYIAFCLIFTFSCIDNNAKKQDKIYQILANARKLKQVHRLINYSPNQYTILYDDKHFYNLSDKKKTCIRCGEKQFNEILLNLENIENASSKFHLKYFAKIIYYIPEEDYLKITFHDPIFHPEEKGVEYRNGRWKDFIVTPSWE